MEKLLEAVSYDYYKDKLSKIRFDKLMELDPTKDLKYGRWIVQAYLNEFGEISKESDDINEKQAELRSERAKAEKVGEPLLAQRISSEYAETVFEYSQLMLSPEGKAFKRFWNEDTSKITEDLITYTKLKNKKKLPNERDYNILNFKTFVSLFELINSIPESVIDDLTVIDPSEYEKWYQGDGWTVLVPLSHKAACKYGKGTRWCTTAKDDDHYFKYYSEDGPLINILSPDKKWQIHFESNQWMDALDEPIENREKFINSLPEGVRKAIFDKTKQFIFASREEKAQIVETIVNSDSLLSNLQYYAKRESASDLAKNDYIDRLDELIPDKFILWAVSDSMDEFFYDTFGGYNHGYNKPWVFLEDNPENPDEIDVDTTDRWWKEDVDLWSEEQREEAGQKAEDEARDETVTEFIRNLTHKRRDDRTDTFDTLYDTAVTYINTFQRTTNMEDLKEFIMNILTYFPDVTTGMMEKLQAVNS